MLFDLTSPCYLTTFSGKKCLSGKVISAFLVPLIEVLLYIPSYCRRSTKPELPTIHRVFSVKRLQVRLSLVLYLPPRTLLCVFQVIFPQAFLCQAYTRSYPPLATDTCQGYPTAVSLPASSWQLPTTSYTHLNFSLSTLQGVQISLMWLIRCESFGRLTKSLSFSLFFDGEN
jgi:hypothetical protein